MKDEMCNFYMMYWYDPREDELGKSVEDSCDVLFEDKLDFPQDSDVRLSGSGPKMEMKRNFEDGEFAGLMFVVLAIPKQTSQFFNFIWSHRHNPITSNISLRKAHYWKF